MPRPAALQCSHAPSSRDGRCTEADIGKLESNGRIIWRLTGAMAAVAVFAYWHADLSFERRNGYAILICVAVFLAISALYRRFRPDPSVIFGTESCAQLTLVLALGCALSYPLATIGFPYCDATLNGFDTWLGLDWRGLLHFVNERPLLSMLSNIAYRSIALQFPVLVFSLVATSRLEQLQQYVIATALALAITLAVFAFMPAGGTYAFLQIQPDEFSNLSPVTTAKQLAQIDALRAGLHKHVHGMEGLITFPSFHAVWAFLFMWGFYRIKPLRYGAILLNLGVLAATPVQGAHYFVDLLGGAVVAAVAIYLATQLTRDQKVADLGTRPARPNFERVLPLI